MALARVIASPCAWGFQRGFPLGIRLCSQSVVCFYTRSALLQK